MNETKWYVKKGLWLAVVLIVLSKAFLALNFYSGIAEVYIIGAAFALIVLSFIKTEKLKNLFITGFVGLGVLIGAEIILTSSGLGELLVETLTNSNYIGDSYLFIFSIYSIGFIGSAIGTAVAIALTLSKANFNLFPKLEEVSMEKSMKVKLLAYALLSFIGFTYLVLPENAGVSVPIFAFIQFACLYFVVPNKKSLWLFIPIFILSLNSFISGNSMWRVSNFIVILALYSVMFCKINILDTSLTFFVKIFKNIIQPFRHFSLPIKWCGRVDGEKTRVIKRVFIGLLIAVPFMAFLISILSSADSIFSNSVTSIFNDIWNIINFNTVLKVIYGVFVGLYLFGLVYNAYVSKEKTQNEIRKRKQGDLIILNIFLISTLAVYTMFVVVQFKYLFAGASLPYGLKYFEYARKGFFELLFLTGVNIFIILLTVNLTRENRSLWGKITKWLCSYLCAITVILLISSFYRMWLYTDDDGLTRLRFLVFGFLIFEFMALLITFYYIIKPRFNIAVVYLSIGLVYYLLLNIIPVDYYVAKSQVDRYMRDGKGGIPYVITLSSDAAPQIERLLGTDADEHAKYYFTNLKEHYNSFVPRWQRYNVSIDKALK